MAKAQDQNPTSPYAGVKRVTYLSTSIGRTCEHCGQSVGCMSVGTADLDDSINHFVEQHGYRVLHVGQETSHDDGGRPWHSTVAVLGVADVPPLLPTPGPLTFRDVSDGE